MNDSDFDDLLRSAGEEVPLPADFRRSVWRKIESSSVGGWHRFGWFQRLALLVERPLGTVSVISAVSLLGLWLGLASIPEPTDAKLVYIESVSPFAKHSE